MARILQFKITLLESKPSVWRQFQVMESYRLDRFHQLIQIVMGWYNSHLHEFTINGICYGMTLEDFMDDFDQTEDETKFFLKNFKLKAGDRIGYLYDFGDSWKHLLKLEKVLEGSIGVPVCLKGKGACPPEDCGGIWGFNNLNKLVKNPNHPEYQEYTDWLPEGYDPTVFDLEATNAELESFGNWHNQHPRAKSTPWHQI